MNFKDSYNLIVSDTILVTTLIGWFSGYLYILFAFQPNFLQMLIIAFTFFVFFLFVARLVTYPNGISK